MEPPVPVAFRPLVEAANYITVALLPKLIRDQYGFFPLPAGAAARAHGQRLRRLRQARRAAVHAEPAAADPGRQGRLAVADDSPRIRTGRIGRTAGVGGMVARQGLGWAGTRIANLTRDEERSQQATDERVGRIAVQIARQLGEMKGAAMKIGQVLSTIELPGLSEEGQEEFRAALAQLRDNAPTFGFDDIRKVVEGDLGGKISDHFAEFERGGVRGRLDRPGPPRDDARRRARSRSRSSTRASPRRSRSTSATST